jgi:hypothetical protein
MPDAMKRVEEIQARVDAVGDQEWSTHHDNYGDEWWFDGDSGPGQHVIELGDEDAGVLPGNCGAEAALIANAPADISWLVQEHHRLSSRIAYLEGWKQGAEEAHNA